MNKMDIAIKIMKEMQLNYKSQFPKIVPNMTFVINEIESEIAELTEGDSK